LCVAVVGGGRPTVATRVVMLPRARPIERLRGGIGKHKRGVKRTEKPNVDGG